MKKLLSLAAIAALAFGAISCTPKEEPIYDVTIQLTVDNQPFAVKDITINLTDGVAAYSGVTDSTGVAEFKVIAGSYTATTNFSNNMSIYNGTNISVVVSANAKDFKLALTKSKGSQIILKEVYIGGCFDAETETKYGKDTYFIIYNNSQFEADASDVVFGLLGPSRAENANGFYQGDPLKLKYEDEGWVPATAGIFWFDKTIKMEPYSQIVVVVYNATDHTNVENGGFTCSVDLSKPEYYWMNGTDVPGYGDAKYIVSDNIPKEHYLSGAKICGMKSWMLDMTMPAIFIGNMNKAEASALVANTTAYDTTLGGMMGCVKFPQENVLDGIEVFQKDHEEKSLVRFPATVNSGYVSMETYLGYSAYRNVNEAATEALPENEGKLVYGYDGAVDPELEISKIDAEASIANGAHIIYMDTNNSGLDFHERKTASLKK